MHVDDKPVEGTLVNRHCPALLHGPMVILILDWTKEG
jgi:hypothetical protein